MLRVLLAALLFCALASPAQARYRHQHRPVADAGRIVAHPVGCPRVQFCACGAAVKIFGSPIRALWLAAAWFKFPSAEPAPYRVAVRRHHVFVLLDHVEGDVWTVYDANSGHHLTRVHQRSIAGWTIVDPQGSS